MVVVISGCFALKLAHLAECELDDAVLTAMDNGDHFLLVLHVQNASAKGLIGRATRNWFFRPAMVR